MLRTDSKWKEGMGMEFFTWLAGMRELPRYILSRGLLLTCVLLGCCVAVLLHARQPAADTALLMAYAQHIQTSALLVMGAVLIGSALMEDVMEYKGIP